MVSEFLKEEMISSRQLRGWDRVKHGEDLFKSLLDSFSVDYKRRYELEGLVEEVKELKEDNEKRFINFVLRMLEVADFWERVMEPDTVTLDKNIEKCRLGYEFLRDELGKMGIKQDGPNIGEFPRAGKDVAEGKEDRSDLPDGAICGIVKKCYLWEDRVLRKARVITVRREGG